MYNDAGIPLPKQVDLDYIQRLPLPLRKMILRGTPRYNTDRKRLQWMYRSYYGDVTWLDEEIGATLDELERSGKADNTIIIISSVLGEEHVAGLVEASVACHQRDEAAALDVIGNGEAA